MGTQAGSTSEGVVEDRMIGHTLDGRYVLRRRIGAGGQGVVYTAADLGQAEGLGPVEVVAKVLHPMGATDPETIARFEREATRLKSVSHPNIVELLDYGHASDAYIVMEYVRGESLSEYLARRGPLGLAEFVPIAAQILKAVGHVHSRDIMVRDIKPANIMLCRRRGRANFVKLLDFGLARLVHEDHEITSDNVLGTAGYVSPEQIRGEQLDLRVDVFALGVLFYRCLTGELPHGAGSPESRLVATLQDTPRPIDELLPNPGSVPDRLQTLIMECLAKDPAARPPHADALVERLIDCVPASMFRLPRIDGVPTSSLGTGTVRLDEVRQRALGADDAAAVAPFSRPNVSASVADEQLPSRFWLRRSAIAAAVALVGVAAVGWVGSGREPKSDVPHGGIAEAPPADSSASDRPIVAVAAPAAEVSGTLQVDVDPPATVIIDGVSIGHSPRTLTLKPGDHEVRLAADGYEAWSETVEVAQGSTVRLKIALPKRPKPVEEADPVATAARSDAKRPRPSSRPATARPPTRQSGEDARKSTISPGTMPRGRSSKKKRSLDENVW